MKHTRNLFVPCLDMVAITGEGTGHDWAPIDLSTQYALQFNANTETYAYIKDANDFTEITGYALSMSQEIAMESDNPIYSALLPWMMGLPTGSDAKVPILQVMPNMTTGAATVGYMWAEGTVTPDEINSVDGKLTFTLQMNGSPQEGTVAGIGTDTITFTPA